MVCTGVFDRYSRLRLILGHCGERVLGLKPAEAWHDASGGQPTA